MDSARNALRACMPPLREASGGGVAPLISLPDQPVASISTAKIPHGELADCLRQSETQPQPAQLVLVLYCHDGAHLVPLQEQTRVVVGRANPSDVIIRNASLSRRHAAIELRGGELWLEDLDSTNGTWLEGRRITRSQAAIDANLAFGAVSAAIRALNARDMLDFSGVSHDRFQQILAQEQARTQSFSRRMVLAMFRPSGNSRIRDLLDAIRANLRPFDQFAIYSADIVEVLLPEADEAQASELADRVSAAAGTVRCGVASLPDHASSAAALLPMALRALDQTTADTPTRVASTSNHHPCIPEPVADDKHVVFTSQAMRDLFAMVDRVALANIPVLIQGETGTGKEIVAHAIHRRGPRATAPMLCVNCAALPQELLCSTLFGHERGAFTGANRRSAGIFEAANGGAVFLDEIAELPAPAQAALLRVLEDGRFTRVGSTTELSVDVRVIAASNRDLEQLSKQGHFREDLLFRLNTVTLAVPALRDRRDDIEPLALHFLRQACARGPGKSATIGSDTMALLRRHEWPGNVRELRNVIERCVVIAQRASIAPVDLPWALRNLQHLTEFGTSEHDIVESHELAESIAATAERPMNTSTTDLRERLREYELELILKAVDQAAGDRMKAAESLGLPLRTLNRRLQSHRMRNAGPGDQD